MKAKFKLKKHKSEGASLSVEGDLTVASGKEFKDNLLKLLAATGNGTAEISLKAAQSIDVSALQLMYAAMEALKKNKNKFSVLWPDNETVNALLAKSGIKQALQF